MRLLPLLILALAPAAGAGEFLDAEQRLTLEHIPSSAAPVLPDEANAMVAEIAASEKALRAGLARVAATPEFRDFASLLETYSKAYGAKRSAYQNELNALSRPLRIGVGERKAAVALKLRAIDALGTMRFGVYTTIHQDGGTNSVAPSGDKEVLYALGQTALPWALAAPGSDDAYARLTVSLPVRNEREMRELLVTEGSPLKVRRGYASSNGELSALRDGVAKLSPGVIRAHTAELRRFLTALYGIKD